VWRAIGSMRDVPSEAAVSPVILECKVEEMHDVTLLRLNQKKKKREVGRWGGVSGMG